MYTQYNIRNSLGMKLFIAEGQITLTTGLVVLSHFGDSSMSGTDCICGEKGKSTWPLRAILPRKHLCWGQLLSQFPISTVSPIG